MSPFGSAPYCQNYWEGGLGQSVAFRSLPKKRGATHFWNLRKTPKEIRENYGSPYKFAKRTRSPDFSSFPTRKHVKNCIEVPPPHLQGAEFSFRWLLSKVFFVDLHILKRHSEQMCHKMSCQMLKTGGWYEEHLQVIPGCKPKKV